MRGRVVVAAAVGLLVTLAAVSARAAGIATETPTVPLLSTTTTTSTTSPPSTTTTQPGSSSTTTTTSPPGPGITIPGTPLSPTSPPGQPPPPPLSQPQPSTVPPPPTTPGGGTPDSGGDQPVPASEIPSNYQALINAVVRSKPSNTGALLDAVAALQDFGLTLQEAAIVGFGHFPVAGYAGWSDDWLMPRRGPPFHLHQGNDVFAAYGTPIRAPYDGVLRYENAGLGGLAAYVTMADRTFFYMAHMSATVQGLQNGSKVHQGQVVGFVGDSGNAVGGAPHCHFEVHPGGGPAVDPKSYLDGWIAEALANVPALVNYFRGNEPQIIIATGLTRSLAFASPGLPSADQLLWASSMSPSGGALRLAQAQASRAGATVDWSRREREELAYELSWAEGRSYAVGVLAPLTPPPLQQVFSRGSS